MYYRRTIQVCYFVWYDGFQALINSLYWLYNDVFLRNNIDNSTKKKKKGKRKNGFAPNSLTKILSSFARTSQFPLPPPKPHMFVQVFLCSACFLGMMQVWAGDQTSRDGTSENWRWCAPPRWAGETGGESATGPPGERAGRERSH